METILSVAVGLGIAAACGLRVFLPLLVLSVAGLTGQLTLSPGFHWVSTVPGAVALGTATVAEVLAYYLPWVDHALDTIATPSAVVAGVLAVAAVAVDLPPVVRYGIALIGGGGIAGMIQGATVLLRLKSTAATGGVGNPAVATAELIGAASLAVLAILIPLIALAVVGGLLWWAFRRLGRIVFGRSGAQAAAKGTGS